MALAMNNRSVLELRSSLPLRIVPRFDVQVFDSSGVAHGPTQPTADLVYTGFLRARANLAPLDCHRILSQRIAALYDGRGAVNGIEANVGMQESLMSPTEAQKSVLTARRHNYIVASGRTAEGSSYVSGRTTRFGCDAVDATVLMECLLDCATIARVSESMSNSNATGPKAVTAFNKVVKRHRKRLNSKPNIKLCLERVPTGFCMYAKIQFVPTLASSLHTIGKSPMFFALTGDQAASTLVCDSSVDAHSLYGLFPQFFRSAPVMLRHNNPKEGREYHG